DTLNRLIYLENRTSAGDVISCYFYTLGPTGNRLSVSENTGRVMNYTYDLIYRLIQEEILDPVNGNETISYSYDSKGNRLTKTDSTGTVAYSYDVNDRLLTETGPAYVRTYSYDLNGNTITKSAAGESIAYDYNFENQLTGMQTLASTVAYQYDADGIRVAQDVDGAQTVFIVDKNRQYAQILEERDTLGSLTVSYIHGDDLVSQDRSGVKSYFHHDGLTSTRALTNSSETVTDTYDYEAFGNIIQQTGNTQNSFLFAGESLDSAVNWYYLRARYYNPGIGRFVTTDPLEGKPLDPVTLHKYMYAKMNPVMYIDPSGKFFIGTMLSGGFRLLGGLAAGYYIGGGIEMIHNYNRVVLQGENATICGSGSTGVIVPDDPFGFHFSNPCSIHDACYGGSGTARSNCDWDFYENMMDVCRDLRNNGGGALTYCHCSLTARHYYIMVMALGWTAYQP
ncbi:MAG: hypothetical protein HF978_21650, partial [Desulfobacteraceae bacterium]|nr:hypothetical protein [Desulfobacteraceae bacterium]MBC2758152.1 hypothetical protein [Desulfobacteraceae bacterium]